MQKRTSSRMVGAAIGGVIAPLLITVAGALWGGYTKRLPCPVGLDQKSELEQFKICAIGWGEVFAIVGGLPAILVGVGIGGAIGVLVGRDQSS